MPPRKQFEFEQLVSADRAARFVGESVARWWLEVAADVAGTLTDENLDELYREQLSSLASAFDADEISVLMANEDGTELTGVSSAGIIGGNAERLSLHVAPGESVSGRALAARAPIVIEDATQMADLAAVLVSAGLRSFVAAPMFAGEHIVGVLQVGSRQVSHFGMADAEALEVVATRLGQTVQRVRIFEAEHHAREAADSARIQAELLAGYLERLRAYAAAIAGAIGVDDVIEVLLRSLETPSSAAVWLAESNRLVRSPVTRFEVGLRTLPGDVALDGSHPIAEAARTRSPIYVNQADAARMWAGVSEGGDPSGSYGVAPFVLGARCLGVLVTFYQGVDYIDGTGRSLLVVTADQTVQALERAVLFEGQRRLLEYNAFLSRAAKVLAEAEASGVVAILDRLAMLALPMLGDICLIDVLDADGHLDRIVARHWDPALQPLVDTMAKLSPDASGPHPVADVVASHETRWANDVSEEFLRRTSRNEDHLRALTELGFRSYIVVPLVAATGLVGSLTFISTTRPYVIEDVRFAEMLAEQVAAVTANASRYESAAQTSRVLQDSLLPEHLAAPEGLEVASRYLAATGGLDVGGDFYDLVALGGDALLFVIGDVEGHDRRAAALMGQLRSAIRVLSAQHSSPSELIGQLGASWDILGFERMATVLVGCLHLESGALELASAGHYPPLRISSARADHLEVRPGPPLGAIVSGPEPWTGVLDVGDVLLGYTDGVIDERSLGSDVAMEALARIAEDGAAEPEAVCDRVLSSLRVTRTDDVALLSIRRR